ncbi:hypothetical protein AB0F88_22555 [Streptosporangium sp. NPDC023963]|uniref:hypothetical protein n=1 Tax=Streptosporangium sp. NPDC023963 TaxID=3155608 RepID=UPI003449DC66
MEPELVHVRYPKTLSQHDQDEIFDLLDRLGVAAEIGAFDGRRTGTAVELWTLLVVVPLATYSNAFLQKAGESTWLAVTQAAKRVALARRERAAGEPLLIIEIKDHQTSFEFPSELDLDARLAIVRLLREQGPAAAGRYRWHAARRSWQRAD